MQLSIMRTLLEHFFIHITLGCNSFHTMAVFVNIYDIVLSQFRNVSLDLIHDLLFRRADREGGVLNFINSSTKA
jgi:hypothetical protein